MKNLWESRLAGGRALVLDGGLATELERRGADLSDALWSARVLVDAPEQIAAVHLDYLRAGADVLITASYQASLEGFQQRGLQAEQVFRLWQLSVELALEAVARFQQEVQAVQRPLVAASIGPYGAFLADGSEYRGDYGVGCAALAAWHRPRMRVLAGTAADLLACETIPCLEEARALTQLLPEFAPMTAWLSFSCRDGERLASGEPWAEAVALAEACPQVVAVGVNCTAPREVEPLLAAAAALTCKPLLCYPNSGEQWDAERRCWLEGTGLTDFAEPARRWYAAGARLIGGCCRTTPADIAAIARALAGGSGGV